MRGSRWSEELSWLNSLVVRGAEGEDESGEDETEESDDNQSDDSTDDSEEEDSEEEEGEDKDDKVDVGKLKKALREERLEKRRLLRENKRLKRGKKSKDDQAGESDDDKSAEELRTERERNSRLAAQVATQAVNFEITKAAKDLNFRDLDDAITLVRRGDIDYEQDEDDPSEVTVDETSVREALEDLAERKPHLILADGETEASGDRTSGRKKIKNDELDEEKLRGRYSALRQ